MPQYLLFPRRNRFQGNPVGTEFGYVMPVNARVNLDTLSLPAIVKSSSVIAAAPLSDASPETVLGLPSAAITSNVFALLGTITVTIANPAVVNYTAHGLVAAQEVRFTTTSALPTGINAMQSYYVKNETPNTFELALTPGGASVATTGSQSGVHSCFYKL